jgi:hypothetical protein
MATVTHTTKNCPFCGKASKLKLDKERYEKWQAGEYIQVAFNNLSADEREHIMSGTHKGCWPWSDED